MSDLPKGDPGPSPQAERLAEDFADAQLTPAARSYVRRLEPGRRGLAREWMLEDDQVFKARVGVLLGELASTSTAFKLMAGLGMVGGGAAGGFAATLLRGLAVALF